MTTRYIFLHYQLTPLSQAFWRTVEAIAILLLGFLIFKPRLLRIGRQDLPILVLLGAGGMGGFLATYSAALYFTTVATAVVLLYTAPAWTILLSWRFLREPMTTLKVASVALAFAGCVFVSRAYNPGELKLNIAGIVFGLGAGLCFGVRTVVSKFGLRRRPPLTITIYTMVFAAMAVAGMQTALGWLDPAILGPLAPMAAGQLFDIFEQHPSLWIFITIVSVGGQVIAFFLYTASLQHIDAGMAMTIGSLEPVFAGLLALVFLGEAISPSQALGAALVLAALVLFGRGSTPAEGRRLRAERSLQLAAGD